MPLEFPLLNPLYNLALNKYVTSGVQCTCPGKVRWSVECSDCITLSRPRRGQTAGWQRLNLHLPTLSSRSISSVRWNGFVWSLPEGRISRHMGLGFEAIPKQGHLGSGLKRLRGYCNDFRVPPSGNLCSKRILRCFLLVSCQKLGRRKGFGAFVSAEQFKTSLITFHSLWAEHKLQSY